MENKLTMLTATSEDGVVTRLMLNPVDRGFLKETQIYLLERNYMINMKTKECSPRRDFAEMNRVANIINAVDRIIYEKRMAKPAAEAKIAEAMKDSAIVVINNQPYHVPYTVFKHIESLQNKLAAVKKALI